MTKAQAIKILFDNLKPCQQNMFVSFFETKSLKYILHCSRRLGKTYYLCTVAIIQAINRPNSQIKYASVTQKSVKNMIMPIMKELFRLLPHKYQGQWRIQDGCYQFPNGSVIQVAGVNNQKADDLRGTSADLAIIDEAGFIDDLDYLVTSVLIQQLISTGGRMLVASSSPLSPAHSFADMIHTARAENNYASYDINMAGYPDDVVEQFIKESGGRNSTAVRREYFNELKRDDIMAIIPEWKEDYIADLPKSKYDSYYHLYESMDLGVRDKTGVLFGKYIFDKAQLYIEQEWTCSGQDSTTKNIANNVKRIEAELGYQTLYKRVADNNALITLQDLSNEFNLYFGATSKDSLAAMVNEVRLWVDSGRLIVHPRCKELIACLDHGVYQDEKRQEFGRSKSLGHYDLLASLIYMVRNIDTHTNPIPRQRTNDKILVPYQEDENADIKKIFNVR